MSHLRAGITGHRSDAVKPQWMCPLAHSGFIIRLPLGEPPLLRVTIEGSTSSDPNIVFSNVQDSLLNMQGSLTCRASPIHGSSIQY